MPTVNIYHQTSEQRAKLSSLAAELKTFVAKELTCGDITLKADEVSIRFVETIGDFMIGAVEVDIHAHAFKERVEKQDEICLRVMDYIQKKEPSLGIVKVWLVLSELGHSWK
jgi:hypothetical protein